MKKPKFKKREIIYLVINEGIFKGKITKINESIIDLHKCNGRKRKIKVEDDMYTIVSTLNSCKYIFEEFTEYFIFRNKTKAEKEWINLYYIPKKEEFNKLQKIYQNI